MKRYFSIDHKILFFTGYLFYLFTPLLVGFTDLFTGYPGIELYKSFFIRIPHRQLIAYLIITLSWIPSFYSGHILFAFIKPFKRSLGKFKNDISHNSFHVLSYLLFAILFLFILIGRNSLFGGYSSYDVGVRGKFSTLLILYNFFLIYQLLVNQKISIIFWIGIATTVFLLLSMGGRMYVFQTFIVFLVYKTSFAVKQWYAKQLIPVILLGFILGGVSGIWRMGETFTFSRASYSFLAEPVFTWFSTSSFLVANNIPVINFPANFLTSFFNLVPNTIIKLQAYIVSTGDMGFITESPLGADSIWSNLVINFGSYGSFFFILLTGFLLNLLRHFSEQSKFGACYYIMVCGLIPFQLFRDGFYLLNKQLLFNFFLLPMIILYALKTLDFISKSKKN